MMISKESGTHVKTLDIFIFFSHIFVFVDKLKKISFALVPILLNNLIIVRVLLVLIQYRNSHTNAFFYI